VKGRYNSKNHGNRGLDQVWVATCRPIITYGAVFLNYEYMEDIAAWRYKQNVATVTD